MMIPGAWEPRRAIGGSSFDDDCDCQTTSGHWRRSDRPPQIQRPGMANWLELSIFTATLLAAMWLAMTVFFESPSGLVI